MRAALNCTKDTLGRPCAGRRAANARPSAWKRSSQASLVGGIAQDLGLPRPPSQRFAKNAQLLSTELLDQADADFIFYAARGQGLARSPLWPRLNAVRSGRAFEVDTDTFYLNAGPTAARSVLDTLVTTVSAALPTALSPAIS